MGDGRILVMGSGKAEVYTATGVMSGYWTGVAGPKNGSRIDATALLLPNGKVFLAGGSSSGAVLSTTELFSPAPQALAPSVDAGVPDAGVSGPGAWGAGAPLTTSRSKHTATLLLNGKVLLVGGSDGSKGLVSCELYDPSKNSMTITGTMSQGRYGHTAVLLQGGKVLVCGGTDGLTDTASCEVFAPSAGSWSKAAAMTTARRAHGATTLGDGRVLVAGGKSKSSLSSVEIYNPATGSWSAALPLAKARSHHSASLTSWGGVVVAGGTNGSTAMAVVEVFDPALGTWSSGSMSQARSHHTATVMTSGTILVTGGTGNKPLASAETLSAPSKAPASGSWKSVSSMLTPRADHTSTLLASGKVLVAGGYGGTTSSAELFDPVTSSCWSP